MWPRAILLVLGLLVVAAAGGLGVVYLGLYDISATDQHTPPTFRLLTIAMRRSVALRARAVEVPVLDDPKLVALGRRRFDEYCVPCHGGPGVARAPAAMGMTPLPENLVQTGREWTAAEVYWTVKHGIKMTGMPAWKYRLSEEELWAVVAFVTRELPTLSPSEYRAWREESG